MPTRFISQKVQLRQRSTFSHEAARQFEPRSLARVNELLWRVGCQAALGACKTDCNTGLVDLLTVDRAGTLPRTGARSLGSRYKQREKA